MFVVSLYLCNHNVLTSKVHQQQPQQRQRQQQPHQQHLFILYVLLFGGNLKVSLQKDYPGGTLKITFGSIMRLDISGKEYFTSHRTPLAIHSNFLKQFLTYGCYHAMHHYS